MGAEFETFQRLTLALGIGFLIGLERGFRFREEAEGLRQAGIRTFTLFGFLGGLSGLLGREAGDAVMVVMGLGAGGLIVAGYLAGYRRQEDAGMTTEVAAFVTFVLGALAVRGDMVLAAASAVVVVALLDMKTALHAFLKRLESAELNALIKLLMISVVLLPILPNRGYGPGGVLNPYELWWVVVLIAAASLGGYAAIRAAGTQAGTLAMGAMGGIASSTALTVSASRMAAMEPLLAPSLSGSIAAASAVMFVRTVIIAYVLSPAVGLTVLPAFFAAFLAAAVFAAMQTYEGSQFEGGAKLHLSVPSDIGLAMKFAAALAAFAVVLHYVRLFIGDAGVLGLAALSGLMDVDATTVTLARSAAQSTQMTSIAAYAILIATGVNMAVKAGISFVIGGMRLAQPVFMMTGAAVLSAAAVLAIQAML